MKKEKLLSWGRYPNHPQTPHGVHWRNSLFEDLNKLTSVYGSTLAYGKGRSYGDSCLATSNCVIDTQGLDRFISVDWATGVVQAEAGVTLQEVLKLAIPRGWFLPVTPGSQYVTLGGALANDVHGKNHHVRGTFGCYVHRFSLVRSDKPEAICSVEENTELFAATIGGLGLTGVIAWVELQLMPIQSSQMDTTSIRFDSLHEFFLLSNELDQNHEYTVAWIDCLAKGSNLGRGIFMAANHAQTGPLKFCMQKKITVPLAPPVSIMNRYTLQLFNQTYYNRHKVGRQQKLLNYDPFFYPLDRILKWNLLYGKKGFQQYQCVIPQNYAEDAMHELLKVIAQERCGSFLAVLKQCGEKKSPGLMSFPMSGVSLALDFPQTEDLRQLFITLDKITREAGGRLYPAKDAHMTGEDFRHFYPHWIQVERLRDPALYSHFWQRVVRDLK